MVVKAQHTDLYLVKGQRTDLHMVLGQHTEQTVWRQATQYVLQYNINKPF